MKIAGIVVAALLAAACSKKNADTAEAPPKGTLPVGERVAVPGAKGGGPVTGGAPEAGPDTSYQLAVEPPSQAAVGAPAVARVVVKPSAGWKMNHEYPTKLKLVPPEGVSVEKQTLEVGDAKLADQELSFDVKLTAARAGTYKVGGEIKFAVCTPETCDPKKQEIAIDLVAVAK